LQQKRNNIFAEKLKIVGLDVLTPVVKKNSVFWDITQCSQLKANEPFGEMYRLHLQSQRVSQAKHRTEAGSN
jgi:hypothetical protein